MKEITFEKFVEKYKPIKNSLNESAPYDGCMFETYGDELEKVRKHLTKYKWTIVDGENETSYILPGWHIVNRQGFFITERAWKNDELVVNLNTMISTGEAMYACMDFIEEELGIPLESFEDKLHNWWSNKF